MYSGVLKFMGDVRRYKGIDASNYLGFSYRPHKLVELGARVGLFQMSGNDAHSNINAIKVRNLRFISLCKELSLHASFYPLDRNRYLLAPYATIGTGVLFFNPKAPLNGKWYELQPLGTEGQGINGQARYSRNTRVLNFGAGTHFKINKRFSVGVEFLFHLTNSDYLDDVSGQYYDKASLNAYYGNNNSSLLSDPSYLVSPDLTSAFYPITDANGNTSYLGIAGESRGDIRRRRDHYITRTLSFQYSF